MGNNISILDQLNDRVNETPDKIIYAFLDVKGEVQQSYTYASFQERTDAIASQLQARTDIKPGDHVLLVYPAGLEVICAFFACVKLGVIPVPVYPPSGSGFESTLNKMAFIAEDCGAVQVLTQRSFYWSIQVHLTKRKSQGKGKVLQSLNWEVTDESLASGQPTYTEGYSETLFLQYTSGSTSDPKGVMVSHENIIDNCEKVADHTPIGVSWLPQYHDMGLIGYYLYFALKGGTTYGFSPVDFIQRPALWLETISKYGGTASSAPNFAFEYCMQPGKISAEVMAELDLSSLKFLMTAAEPINPDSYERFLSRFASTGLRREAYFGAYGLAEFTLAVTNYGRDSICVEEEELLHKRAVPSASKTVKTRRLMSVGRALGDTQIKIVSEDHVGINEGQVGEIWLKGRSKCNGYWGRPDLSEATFNASVDGTTGWLRTGDLGFLMDNELYVCGRLKDMLIIRGLNYYPQDIEQLVASDPDVRDGAVVAYVSELGATEKLSLVVGLKHNKRIPEVEGLRRKISAYFGIDADAILFVPARELARTSSGKIRRTENKRKALNDEFTVLERFETTTQTEVKLGAKEDDYFRLFSQYKLTGSEAVSLGDAGFDSLKLAEFAHDLRTLVTNKGHGQLAEEMDLRLLQKIIVADLFALLQDVDQSSAYAKFRFKRAFAQLQTEFRASEKEQMIADTELVTESIFDLEPSTTLGSILVTGGTGFFGPFLIKSLLEQNTADIYVLVRAEDSVKGKERLVTAFEKIDPADDQVTTFKQRMHAVCGNLEDPKLGLTEASWGFLATEIETIYHNGALVNYLLDYGAMRKANVLGTQTIIELAGQTRRKVLNYVSTTFIFGWSVKDVLMESDENEDMEFLDFGYSQSKWVAEQLVLKAREKGLRARIFRPALISPSTQGKGYNFDISVRLLVFMIKHGLGTNAQNQVSFTPADLGANNIVAISNQLDSEGLTFNVTRDNYASMKEITSIMGDILGIDFKHYDLKDFVPEVVKRCDKDDLLFPLLNFLVRSVDNINNMEFKRYDNSNYRKFRDQSPHGQDDCSQYDVVLGILKFMMNEGVIKTGKELRHVE